MPQPVPAQTPRFAAAKIPAVVRLVTETLRQANGLAVVPLPPRGSETALTRENDCFVVNKTTFRVSGLLGILGFCFCRKNQVIDTHRLAWGYRFNGYEGGRMEGSGRAGIRLAKFY